MAFGITCFPDMVDIEDLDRRFVQHLGTLKSAKFASTLAIGVEGSFRIEVIPVLREMGAEKIGARFDFPSGGQADLHVERQGHVSVFEFMCLVEWADAEKLRRFPKQLDRLSDRRKSCLLRRSQDDSTTPCSAQT